MALVQRTINQCDVCGHEWIPRSAGERCGNRECRSTKWNGSAGPLVVSTLPTAPLPPAKVDMAALRAICAGTLPSATTELPEPQLPCTYRETVRDVGAVYGCSLLLGHKGPHKRGIKLDDVWD